MSLIEFIRVNRKHFSTTHYLKQKFTCELKVEKGPYSFYMNLIDRYKSHRNVSNLISVLRHVPTQTNPPTYLPTYTCLHTLNGRQWKHTLGRLNESHVVGQKTSVALKQQQHGYETNFLERITSKAVGILASEYIDDERRSCKSFSCIHCQGTFSILMHIKALKWDLGAVLNKVFHYSLFGFFCCPTVLLQNNCYCFRYNVGSLRSLWLMWTWSGEIMY